METTNPYQTPESDLSTAQKDIGYDESKWYSSKGRLGRARYFLASIGYYFVFILAMFLVGIIVGALNLPEVIMQVFMVPVFLAYIIFGTFLVVKRIHDLDWSAWWLLLLIVPLANLVMIFLMLFKPGSEGENRFGLPPRPAKNAVLMIVLALMLIVAIGIVASIAIPAYQQYLTQAQG
jgi:uncharacterized membrane protein YhaH (DUF805 family)